MPRAQTPYTFKKPFMRAIMSFVDGIGAILFYFRKKDYPQNPKRILVLRLDHIGDVVVTEPFLAQLRKTYPESHITFLTTQAGKAVYEKISYLDCVDSFSVPWFNLSYTRKEAFKVWRQFLKKVKQYPADMILELRGDVRHIAALRLAQPKAWITSFGFSGGGFLLNREVPALVSMHAARRNVLFLEPHQRDFSGKISTAIASMPLSKEVLDYVGVKQKKRIAIHPAAGTPSKLWPSQHWVELVRHLLGQEDCELFWVGDLEALHHVKEIEQELNDDEKSKFTNLCGVLPLGQLGTFFKTCDCLFSTDSGPVHIAAAMELKTIVLFSGSNVPTEWGPLNKNAHIVTKEVACSPCRERFCPKDFHECMINLTPSMVIETFERVMQ